MKHVARKRFGQHFLTDAAVIDAIVDVIAPQPGDAMVEIGPGLAALTQPLVERLGKLTVIELDRDLAVRLRNHPQLSVVQADVLKVDFSALAVELAADDPAAGLRPACISPVNPTGGPELVEGPAQRRSVGATDPAPGRPKPGQPPRGAATREAVERGGHLTPRP